MNDPQGGLSASDQAAIQRYRYLVKTAPPDAIEQAHEEAFAQLTPEQRREALRSLSTAVPERERAGARDDPRSLARLATRAELRSPGTVERSLGAGGLFAGGLLSSLAGAFIGSSIAHALFGGLGDPGASGHEDASAQDASQDDGVQEASAEDDGGSDYGADFGDDMGADI